MSTLYLAFQYLRFHAVRSLVLILAVALIVTVPVAIHLLLGASERQLTARADDTPLLIGARGSTLDLVMNSLYFTDDRPPYTSIAASDAVWDGGLATAIPLYVRFHASGAPIVGTTIEYFDLRQLEIADGRGLALLGEVILGANVARRLGLEPGDSIVSTPENLFDLAGSYPLKMNIVGVLAPTGSPDDDAILTDIKTTWVIQGIGHGHDEPVAAAGDVLSQSDNNVVASAAIQLFNEITPENIDSFHFHGDAELFPVSAVIAVPFDTRSGIILRGRYVEEGNPLQIVEPADVVGGLLADIFQVRTVLNVVVITIAVAAGLAIALAFFLSLQLRRAEIETIFKLGCQRMTIMRLVLAEVAIIIAISVIIAAGATFGIALGTEDAVLWLLNMQT